MILVCCLRLHKHYSDFTRDFWILIIHILVPLVSHTHCLVTYFPYHMNFKEHSNENNKQWNKWIICMLCWMMLSIFYTNSPFCHSPVLHVQDRPALTLFAPGLIVRVVGSEATGIASALRSLHTTHLHHTHLSYTRIHSILFHIRNSLHSSGKWSF